jgi:DnaK suppressor protein
MAQLMTIRPEEPLFRELRDIPEEHVHRWHRLLEEREFRLEQTADLERELADDPRRDSVRRALSNAASAALSEIEAALDRLERGVYGDCVWCGTAIPAGRLDVLPMVALCMPCHYHEQLPRQRV